eukprot:TRINITY_DN52395_c0_g1_i2.p1 TRINITY_DN52395_c0_g1~~TRINITY_DN52395_c0_g1_i2.p1  ORF type:complete len:316 (+),score=60.68 TRINITY_DN52395_c0_g1_i2:70-1017(+)
MCVAMCGVIDISDAEEENGTEDADESPYKDIACEACGREDFDKSMLLCDGCDRGWHIWCTVQHLTRVPRGKWYCDVCKPPRRGQQHRAKPASPLKVEPRVSVLAPCDDGSVCIICHQLRSCEMVSQHSASGKGGLCGPHSICSDCSIGNVDRRGSGGQFRCPVCRKALGTLRRACGRRRQSLTAASAVFSPAAFKAEAVTPSRPSKRRHVSAGEDEPVLKAKEEPVTAVKTAAKRKTTKSPPTAAPTAQVTAEPKEQQPQAAPAPPAPLPAPAQVLQPKRQRRPLWKGGVLRAPESTTAAEEVPVHSESGRGELS